MIRCNEKIQETARPNPSCAPAGRALFLAFKGRCGASEWLARLTAWGNVGKMDALVPGPAGHSGPAGHTGRATFGIYKQRRAGPKVTRWYRGSRCESARVQCVQCVQNVQWVQEPARRPSPVTQERGSKLPHSMRPSDAEGRVTSCCLVAEVEVLDSGRQVGVVPHGLQHSLPLLGSGSSLFGFDLVPVNAEGT